jgi:hypothetical protein
VTFWPQLVGGFKLLIDHSEKRCHISIGWHHRQIKSGRLTAAVERQQPIANGARRSILPILPTVPSNRDIGGPVATMVFVDPTRNELPGKLRSQVIVTSGLRSIRGIWSQMEILNDLNSGRMLAAEEA